MTRPEAELSSAPGFADWRGLAPVEHETCVRTIATSLCGPDGISGAGLRHENPDGSALTVTVIRAPSAAYDPRRTFERLLVSRTRLRFVPVVDHDPLQLVVGDVDDESWVGFGSLPDESQVRLDATRWPVAGLVLAHVSLEPYVGSA